MSPLLSESEALELLTSSKPIERLRGARLLMDLDVAPNLADVRRVRSREKDTWVQSAIDRALSKWSAKVGGQQIDESWIFGIGDTELEDARAQAIQSVTQVILHEIRPLVSEIRSQARREVGDYDSSGIGSAVARVRSFLETIGRLNEASAAPRFIEFDLADLVAEELRAGSFSTQQAIATRSDAVVVLGDPDLLRLALQNAFRNAVEASQESGNQVVVNCAVTDSEAWVVVLDQGVGLPESSEKVWEPGVTKKSKDEHFGWGLTIAQRAMRSIGGSMRLTPREHGGTACEIRWRLPKDEGTL